jgi:glycosyltransferase involved in cell wall biosynthesis
MNYCVSSVDQRCQSVHVVAGLDPAYGGPSYLIPRLCDALSASGAKATVFSVGESNADSGIHRDMRFSQDFRHVPIARDLRLSRDLGRALHRWAPDVRVIHNHGLWLMPNVIAGRAAQRAKKPFIVAPHGMLSTAALAFSPIKKRLFWALLQNQVVRRASCLHATSLQEHDEIRAFGLTNPIAVIPNGIDLPDLTKQIESVSQTDRVVLSLGRIHPKKGLDRLVRAWAMIEKENPAWRLQIVGPEEVGHASELKALAEQIGARRVSIEGSITGRKRDLAYQQSDLFVLPTLNENFAMTVTEALASGTPVISTKGAPWQGLEREGCGWWIDHGIEPLAAALNRALAMPREELKEMGMKGRAWMARDFSWEHVARQTLDLYRWLFAGGDPPGSVRFN